MNATIRTYPTNAIVFYGEDIIPIDYDYQCRIFDNDTDMEETAHEMLADIFQADNYDSIFERLCIMLDRYRK